MEITLANDVADFLQEKVREGACTDATDSVNDLLRAVRDQQFIVTPELETWLLESADQPSSPLTASDFAGIRERVQRRAHHAVK